MVLTGLATLEAGDAVRMEFVRTVAQVCEGQQGVVRGTSSTLEPRSKSETDGSVSGGSSV
eukprot:4161643-Pleurochrysis_carterae.AAC.2